MELNIREIPGYPGYYASRDGKIYSSITNLNSHTYNDIPKEPTKLKELFIRVQVKNLNKTPYRFATVTLYRYHKKFKVSRLVALTWIPNKYPDDFKYVCHIDNNPLNNNVDNLFWASHQINMLQCSIEGRYKSKPPICKGEDNGFSKYSNQLINRVYRFRRKNPTCGYKTLSKLFNITSISTIRKIVRGTHGGLLQRYQGVPLI